jgi:hypothetical protein
MRLVSANSAPVGSKEVGKVEQLQLETVVREIEDAFGAEPPFTDRPLTELETEVLAAVFGDEGFQRYTQDLANRQIIRDYLTNAVMLESIHDDRFAVLVSQAGTVSGRAALSLYMLMSAVESANDIPLNAGAGLKTLRVSPGSPPQLELIPG